MSAMSSSSVTGDATKDAEGEGDGSKVDGRNNPSIKEPSALNTY